MIKNFPSPDDETAPSEVVESQERFWQTALFRAFATLCFLVLACVVGIMILSSPAPKNIYLDGRAAKLMLPGDSTLFTLFESASGEMVRGQLLSVRPARGSGTLSYHGHLIYFNAARPVMIEALGNGGGFSVTPWSFASGGGGGYDVKARSKAYMSLSLPMRTIFTVGGGHFPFVNLSALRESAEVTRAFNFQILSQEDLVVGGAAFGLAVSPHARPTWLSANDSVRIRATGSAPVFLDGNANGVAFSVSYDTVLPINLASPAPLYLPPKVPYTFTGFTADAIVFPGVNNSDIVKGYPVDLTITPKNLRLTNITLMPPLSERSPGNAHMEVSGYGAVTSLKQGEFELLPSELSDLLSSDPTTRGLFGGIIVVLGVAIFSLLKRAGDVIAEAILPDPNGKPKPGDARRL